MNKVATILLAALTSALVAYSVIKLAGPGETASAPTKKESAYERVMRTGVLRCGWADWPPMVLTKDPKTGELKGVAKDIIEAAAKALSLKVEWTEEMAWGSWAEGLKTGRADAFCAAVWPLAAEGREVRYSVPFYYNPVYGYARADDTRFDKGLEAANDPSIRLSGQDGEISEIIARSHFPKAQYVGQPQLTDLMLIFLNVANNKADLVFNAPDVAGGYIDKNPGKLKRVTPEPFEYYPATMAFRMDAPDLEHMFNTAITEMRNNGIIEMILKAHNAPPDQFLRVAQPYQPAGAVSH